MDGAGEQELANLRVGGCPLRPAAVLFGHRCQGCERNGREADYEDAGHGGEPGPTPRGDVLMARFVHCVGPVSMR